jgi:hypothetical protein
MSAVTSVPRSRRDHRLVSAVPHRQSVTGPSPLRRCARAARGRWPVAGAGLPAVEARVASVDSASSPRRVARFVYALRGLLWRRRHRRPSLTMHGDCGGRHLAAWHCR